MIYLVALFLAIYLRGFYPEDLVNILGALAIAQAILLMPPLSYIYETMQARGPSKREEQRLDPLIKRVMKKTGTTIVPRLMMIDSYDPNAAAFNKNTILINTVCLKSFSEDEMSAIIAHEIGHLHYRHSGNALVYYINAGVVSVILWSLKALFTIASAAATSHWLLAILVWPVMAFLFVVYAGPLWVIAYIIQFTAPIAWRRAEYQADDYARRHGYGPGMISALEKLQAYEVKPESFTEKLLDTHPPVAHRIDRLER